MMRRLLPLLLVVALPACGQLNTSLPPAPLAGTAIDEKGLLLASETLYVVALSVSALARTGFITPGSERASRIALALDLARDGINAAEEARKAGSATSYAEAIARATSATALIQRLIRGE